MRLAGIQYSRDSPTGQFAIKFYKHATYEYWLGYRTNFNSFTNAAPGLDVKWAYKAKPEFS